MSTGHQSGNTSGWNACLTRRNQQTGNIAILQSAAYTVGHKADTRTICTSQNSSIFIQLNQYNGTLVTTSASDTCPRQLCSSYRNQGILQRCPQQRNMAILRLLEASHVAQMQRHGWDLFPFPNLLTDDGDDFWRWWRQSVCRRRQTELYTQISDKPGGYY
jgi:hypothetical protein